MVTTAKIQDKQNITHLIWTFPKIKYIDSETFCGLVVDENFQENSVSDRCCLCKKCQQND